MPFSLRGNTLTTAFTQKWRVGNFPFSKIMHEHFSPWRNQFVHSSAQALYLSKLPSGETEILVSGQLLWSMQLQCICQPEEKSMYMILLMICQDLDAIDWPKTCHKTAVVLRMDVGI